MVASVRGMVLPRHLDRRLERLGAGVREEDGVREGVVDKALREALALGYPEQVRAVPKLLRLPRQRLDEVRVRMAERIHRDAGAEIEISLALARLEPNALALLEDNVGARIGRQQRRVHGTSPDVRPGWPEKESAASSGGTLRIL
jgi:hypothetical protein